MIIPSGDYITIATVNVVEPASDFNSTSLIFVISAVTYVISSNHNIIYSDKVSMNVKVKDGAGIYKMWRLKK